MRRDMTEKADSNHSPFHSLSEVTSSDRAGETTPWRTVKEVRGQVPGGTFLGKHWLESSASYLQFYKVSPLQPGEGGGERWGLLLDGDFTECGFQACWAPGSLRNSLVVPELGFICERRTVVRMIADVSPSSENCVTSAYKPS